MRNPDGPIDGDVSNGGIREGAVKDRIDGTQETGDRVRGLLAQTESGRMMEDRQPEAVASPPEQQEVCCLQSEPNAPMTREGFSAEQRRVFLSTLEERLRNPPKHYKRPDNIVLDEVLKVLVVSPKLRNLYEMEKSGGQVDVIREGRNSFLFADCSSVSPLGRRGVTYNKKGELYAVECPSGGCYGEVTGNAEDQAREWGVEIMTLRQYKYLQKLGIFDFNSIDNGDPRGYSRSWLRQPSLLWRIIAEGADWWSYTGGRYEDILCIDKTCEQGHDERMGWRAVLEVPKFNPF